MDSTVEGTLPAQSSAAATGEHIGRFVVLECIGAGAMGTVFAAYDPDLDRKVAVKILQDSSSDPEGRTRSLREARAMATLSHPNVLAVYEVGTGWASRRPGTCSRVPGTRQDSPNVKTTNTPAPHTSAPVAKPPKADGAF